MNNFSGKHIKAVFFDHDDTLVGTIRPKWKHHKYVAIRYYGKNLTDEEITKHWGKPLQELVCLLYGTPDIETAMARNTAHHEEFPKELFTATIPTLQHIKSTGLRTGIITATSRFSFEHDLQLHKVPQEILDYTQTADDTEFHKPDPRVFDPSISWLQERQIQPHEVVYVGDGLHDMKAAKGAGFNFIGVETGLVTAEQFKKAKAVSISSIAKLSHHFTSSI